MNIRKSQIEDKNKIVALLKDSLGESLLKKSIRIWDYKHTLNPFGTSYVLVAEDQKDLIGVRAFMSWEWQIGDKKWQAYRAVDTATHPVHQGKGIFKKLTLQALTEVGKISPCFIFNTPNAQSKSGYKKMGWKTIGNVNVKLWVLPLLLIRYKFPNAINFSNNVTSEDLKVLCEQHNRHLSTLGRLFTPKKPEYLKWRYEENPLQAYRVFSNSNFYIATYVKKHKRFNELRIVEFLGNPNKKLKKEIERLLTAFAKQENCFLISAANTNLFFGAIRGGFGPEMIGREIPPHHNLPEGFFDLNKIWFYCLGDLELF